jgi:ornithine carbamoyltransferase
MAARAVIERPVNLLHDLDLTSENIIQLLKLAERMKSSPAEFFSALSGKSICLLFEKPSLRTRLTFQLAIKQLGGDCVMSDGEIGGREPLKDVARNLDRWVDAIVARTFSQTTIEELARWSSVPVINALSDLYHPCQALADAFTLKERFGFLRGLKLAFVGDGNNVAHSLMLTCARLGIDFSMAVPERYGPNPEILAQAEALAKAAKCSLEIGRDPVRAASGAHAVYTDVWASMGHEEEALERAAAFAPYRVDSALMTHARPDAIFLHCLPAKRGEEVTDEVIESSRSVVFDQAENRVHAQKALLLTMLS